MSRKRSSSPPKADPLKSTVPMDSASKGPAEHSAHRPFAQRPLPKAKVIVARPRQTEPDRVARLQCADCGKRVRVGRSLVGAPRCPSCRERRRAPVASGMVWQPPSPYPLKIEPAPGAYMSSDETLAHLLEYGHQLSLPPAKMKDSLSRRKNSRGRRVGANRSIAGVSASKTWTGYPEPVGRPATRPDEPAGPSLRERTRLWAQRVRPAKVSQDDWELLRLVVVEEMKVPEVMAARGLTGTAAHGRLAKRIERARKAH
jgi:hypothetical protein